MMNLPDALIYGLVIAAILLLQYVIQRFRGPQQSGAPPEEPVPQEEPIPQEEPLPEVWGRAPAIPAGSPVLVERVGRSEALAAAAAIPRRRPAVRSLLGSRRELRRAIVIMTILGPCRAQEPPDIR